MHVATYVSSSFSVIETCSVPALALCLGVLKHRVPLARGWGGGPLSCQNIFCDGFLPKFGGVLFRSDSRQSDIVDSLWECATEQAVMTVAQWHRHQVFRGPLVIGKKKGLRWIHAYVVQY